MIKHGIILLFIFIFCSCSEKIKPLNERLKLDAIEAAKKYSNAFICRDNQSLANSYASTVLLLKGHPVLTHEGIDFEKNRNSNVTLSNEELIKAYRKIMTDIPLLNKVEAEGFVEKMNFDIMSSNSNVATVQTGFEPLKITLKSGDLLLKLTAPNNRKKYEMTILQMRLIENKWKIVAEYLSPLQPYE